MERTKIAVAGTGYVGLSIATLLSVEYDVKAVDTNPEKVKLINQRISPIKDEYIEKFFREKDLNLTASNNPEEVYKDCDIVFIAVPTNYDDEKHYFDTHCVEDVIDLVLEFNKNAKIVIKSTIPIGYTESLRQKYQNNSIFFSPEFLREGHALEDNLNPSRVIIGCDENNKDELKFAKKYCKMMANASNKPDVKTFVMGLTEAESVKLFANSYMAMRVAFFNELDSYCEVKNLNVEEVIKGVCAEPRIGDFYNNPSFGYGGYCFPKDTKQLLANFTEQKHPTIPSDIINAIVESNWSRKMFVMNQILKPNSQVVGIYRLNMKSGSDNFRASAIFDIIEGLKSYNKVVIYEPILKGQGEYDGMEVIDDINEFKQMCDVIVANRVADDLKDVKGKVYSRDIFNEN